MEEERFDGESTVSEEEVSGGAPGVPAQETPAEEKQAELWHPDDSWKPAPAASPVLTLEPEIVLTEEGKTEEEPAAVTEAEAVPGAEPVPEVPADEKPEKKSWKERRAERKADKTHPGGGGVSAPPVKHWRFRAGFVAGAMAALILCGLVTGIAAYVVRYDGGRILPKLGFRPTAEAAVPAVVQPKMDFNTALEKKLAEIDALVENSFIFPVEEQSLLDGAVKGYVAGLDDVYSMYYTPEEYAETLSEADGSYVGIGVVVQQDPKTYTVTALTVYPDSPAEKGGMLKGDVIVKVDGEDVSAWDLSDIVARIRGEEGTDVVVTVFRDGEYLDLPMVRAALDKITVQTEMLEDGIGYLSLTEFDAVSVGQIEEGIKKLALLGMERLVLDLRDNPGGLLTSVVAIADDFLPQADVMYVEDKQANRITYDSKDGMIWEGPMVVLVNGNSASASEVFSGALKDNGRAVLVGEQTFGKGIIQSFFPLSDGSGVKLTTARYFTPNGTDIHGLGVEPNVEAEDDLQTEEDEQLQKAIEEVKKLGE